MIDTKKFAHLRVIVIGDTMIDKYSTGSVARIAQEAPVPVVQVENTDIRAGAAAHTALAVAGLGAAVEYVSVMGDDEAVQELGGIFDAYPKLRQSIYADSGAKTLVRHRVMSGDAMLLRVDSGNRLDMSPAAADYVIQNLTELWQTCDAVIISDYGYGVISDLVLRTIKQLMKQRELFLAVDSRDLQRYKSLRPALVKPNEAEAMKLLAMPAPAASSQTIDVFSRASERILSLTGARHVALTVGSNGVLCLQTGVEPLHYAPPFVSKLQESGAGDSFIAAATLGMAAGMSLPETAHFSNGVAAMSIDLGSTGICTLRDLANLHGHSKVMSKERLLTLLDQKKREGKTVVFTNGCFDLLHPGHVRLLEQARAEGDLLVVAVNTDDSVRRLKGSERPINTLEDRCAVLAGLEAVDYIVPFDETTPEVLISEIQPDVFVKAGYTLAQLPEADVIRKHHGKIKLFDTIPGSTSEIISRIKD